MADQLRTTVMILLVKGDTREGDPMYAYVAVRGDRLVDFMTAQQAGLFYPGDHGIIIESGLGEPPSDVRKMMETKYGFDHQALIGIPQDDADLWLLARFDVTDTLHVRGATSITAAGININKRLIEYFRKRPQELRSIHPRRFEELVAELFAGFGYTVELTKRTRDGGVDVIAVRHAEVNTRYLIECKCPSIRGYVSVRPVRELLGLKKDTGATKVILATTTRFSKEALELQTRNRWELELRDYDGILEWIRTYAP